ncbi:hypothetical protein GCM10010121_087140 [Streptomyces brasiliensis]|uniref:Uncharacterized protein n=1 Tax=Streptomyces brasiliensis TaxID=1954 RepID=A0A917UKG2_9ACTN|nr:hypothetical protein GCM10010121_087140 [Streptomyces brasiliensis]
MVPAGRTHLCREGRQPVIPLTVLGAGAGGAVVIGMVAGVYPSIRAARSTPTEALATPWHEDARPRTRSAGRAAPPGHRIVRLSPHSGREFETCDLTKTPPRGGSSRTSAQRREAITAL